MCQHCVTDGRITQDELDRRILSGDINIMPIMDLSEEDAIKVSANLVHDLIVTGMDRQRAIECGVEFLSSHYLATGTEPS